MNDSFTTALNTQRATSNWMDAISENLTNIYTPGFKENKMNFQTFLGGVAIDNFSKNQNQGKSTPGTSNANLFLEGKGYFLTRTSEGKAIYTRHGEFDFDAEGVYKTKNGSLKSSMRLTKSLLFVSSLIKFLIISSISAIT